MPSRAQRLADARLTLRRRFGGAREASARPSHHLRDLGSAHPLSSGTRVVSGDEIESDLELDITNVNPPIAQGWIVLTGFIVGLVALFGLKAIVDGESIATAVAVIAIWLVAVGVVGYLERAIELDETGVAIRRWTDRWLGRRGIELGPAGDVAAGLTDATTLEMSSSRGRAVVDLRPWGPTARQDLVDELPIWGIDCAFDRHRHRPDRPGRRLRHQLKRAAAAGGDSATRP
jgi:hypothetical protein